jgi:hypothetical protein
VLDETQWDFSCSGSFQFFVVPQDGTYRFEAWGAGEYRGGYSTGTILLKGGQILYVYVGGYSGTTDNRSWNGGGKGRYPSYDMGWANAGGGATDFRLVPGDWNDAISLNSRIMVAGGSQTAGGVKGSGRNGGGPGGWGYGYDSGGRSGGGGGGYYGGGSTQDAAEQSAAGGGGGSSFISGFPYCVAIDPTDKTKHPRTQDTGANITALNYNTVLSGTSLTWNAGDEIKFSDARMSDGAGYACLSGRHS